MADNVIQLPRPRNVRPSAGRLGLYLRVGFNQHSELLEVMAGGERNFHGLVIEAQHAKRHAQLISHALNADIDVVLDLLASKKLRKWPMFSISRRSHLSFTPLSK